MADDVLPIVVDLPFTPQVRELEGRRIIYTQASLENGKPDRQDEIVAIDALWRSRELFLAQGDLDIAHWAHLPNPLTGRPDLEYRVGVPLAVKRAGNAIFVKGEIFRPTEDPPADSSGERADLFWYALARMNPPARYYPSVYGAIRGVEIVKYQGRFVRRLSEVEWTSIGFHNKVIHPDVPAVSLTPIGPFAKAADGHGTNERLHRVGGLRMDLGTLAKAMTVGLPVQTDTALRTGLQALMPEQVEKQKRSKVAKAGAEVRYARAKLAILKAIRDGDLEPSKQGIEAAFVAAGCEPGTASAWTRRLLTEVRRTLGRGG